MKTNHQTIKELDIQRGDFVDFKTTVSGIITVQVIDILNNGVIHGLDIDGFERHFYGKSAIANHLQ